ncbi:hypothetical protein, conserved [Babesia bigemina]|nr:hypothetical protein, conserved [Babesia bigemina]CDR71542.1 hypothetical protein, conserved [Babesia bigemina]|eukprot:XP_012770488.1 hypothetical protein, conserved [Babesia bigemina]
MELLKSQKDDSTASKLSYVFRVFYGSLQLYLKKEIKRVHDEENKKKNPTPPDRESMYINKVETIFTALQDLLNHITKEKRYDYQVPQKLDELESAVSQLIPDGFENTNTPVLDGIVKGLGKFIEELRKVYISRYDSEKFEGDVVLGKYEISTSGNKQIFESTDYGRKCSKVFLTSLEILTHDIGQLTAKCGTKGTCVTKLINLEVTNNLMNPLGVFLRGCGFVVSKLRDSHEGELRNEARFTGAQIQSTLLNSAIKEAGKIETLRTWKEEKNRKVTASASQQGTVNIILLDVIHFLFGKLESYWRVCHYYIPSHPKTPSNVYQMLQWLDGLWLNPALTSVYKSIKDLFKKPEKAEDINNPAKYKLEAYPSEITYAGLAALLKSVCFYSHDTLIVILGLGDADGRYAVEFRSNPDGLSYPSNAGACFDMFTDILNRVYHQLRFLYRQCQNGTGRSGWEDCYYGKGVGGSAWNCNTMQCAKQIRGQTCPQMVNQRADQIGNQNDNQTCDRHPSCGLKSPLQSFLEDGLQGFLPHSFTKPGCKLECAVPNHFGKPCLTPMGFSDITITASHSPKGKRIKDLLERFCGRPNAPLASLCASLTCVLQRAPQTLGDMFGFFQGYLSSWSGGGIKHKHDAFNEAVKKAYFDVQYDNLTVTSIQQSSNHTNGKHLTGDLFSLIECKTDSDVPVHPCGAYLQAICDDTRVKYSKEHADRYLSWVVYITETFYDLLKKLYDECSSKCGDDKPKCRTGKCPDGCDTQRLPMSEIAKHHASCSSILKCPSTHPTLYKYGFTFGSPFSLSGEKSETTKRTCHDFCKVLKIVVKENNALHKLAHEIIPQFLWDIRQKFFWTTVALWLLSFLYLLHIMVIRLDLLHIKSHLHSPSSHRIAAQSLLAAARVNKLNRVFYLQP